MQVFYPKSQREEAQEIIRTRDFPITWTESDEAEGFTGGVFSHCVQGAPVEPVQQDGKNVGAIYKDQLATYCYLADVRGGEGTEAEQTERVLERLDNYLHQAGMTFSNVLRTWFYNRDILAWYDDFNRVRTDYFNKHDIFKRFIPASTGIGANNPFDAAIVASAFGIQSDLEGFSQRPVDSPLQCSATAYGSSFSRAVLSEAPDHRRLTISGTASIDPSGKTAHVGNLSAQIDLTLEVVEAILKSEGFSWEDTVRGIAYFRNAQDAKAMKDSATSHKIPVIPTVNVVCRDDLLYELEINALQAK